MLPKGVTDKVQISGTSNRQATLSKFIDNIELPREYCGGDSSGCLALGQHPDELRLCEIVSDLLNSDGSSPHPPPFNLDPSTTRPGSAPTTPAALNRSRSDDVPGGEPPSLSLGAKHLSITDISSRNTQPPAPFRDTSLPEMRQAPRSIEVRQSKSMSPRAGIRRTFSSPSVAQQDEYGSQPPAKTATAPISMPQTQPQPKPSVWNPLRYFQKTRKAHMGEENRFIYDKELGQWVMLEVSVVWLVGRSGW